MSRLTTAVALHPEIYAQFAHYAEGPRNRHFMEHMDAYEKGLTPPALIAASKMPDPYFTPLAQLRIAEKIRIEDPTMIYTDGVPDGYSTAFGRSLSAELKINESAMKTLEDGRHDFWRFQLDTPGKRTGELPAVDSYEAALVTLRAADAREKQS